MLHMHLSQIQRNQWIHMKNKYIDFNFFLKCIDIFFICIYTVTENITIFGPFHRFEEGKGGYILII